MTYPDNGRRKSVAHLGGEPRKAMTDSFRLALKPPESLDDFSPSVQMVAAEYATRYLESIGVKPSRTTLDIVHKNVPLGERNIKATLRGKGHVTDEIQIIVPPIAHNYRVPVVINQHTVLQLGIGNQVNHKGADVLHGRVPAAATTLPGSPAATTAALLKFVRKPGAAPPPTFHDLAAQYLHPFNLDTNFAKQSVATAVQDIRALRQRMAGRRAAQRAARRAEGITVPTASGGSGSDSGSERLVDEDADVNDDQDGEGGGDSDDDDEDYLLLPRSQGSALFAPSFAQHGSLSAASCGARSSAARSSGARSSGALAALSVSAGALATLEPSSSDVSSTPTSPAFSFKRLGSRGPRAVRGYSCTSFASQLVGAASAGSVAPGRATQGIPDQAMHSTRALSGSTFASERDLGGVGARNSRPSAGAGSGVGPQPSSLNSLLEDETLPRCEILEELAQDLVVTPEVVLALTAQLESALVQWFQHTAPEALKGRLSAEEFRSALDLLASDPILKLDITLLNFLHQEFVRSSPAFPAHLACRDLGGGGGCPSQDVSRAPSARSYQWSGPGGGSAAVHLRNRLARSAALENLLRNDLGYIVHVRSKEAAAGTGDAAATDGGRTPAGGGGGLGGGTPSRVQPMAPTPTPFCAGQSLAGTPPPMTSPRAQRECQPSPSGCTCRGAAGAPTLGQQPPHGGLHQSSMSPLPPPAVMAATARGGSSLAPDASPALSQRVARGGVPSPAPRSEEPHAPQRTQTSMAGSCTTAATAAEEELSIAEEQPEQEVLQSHRLHVLMQEFATIYKRERQARSGMFFTLPILLLSFRLLVASLYNALYGLWSKTRDGLDALHKMDKAMLELFDPHGYLQRNLSLIQSTPAAVNQLVKHPHKGHEAERIHFNDVSPLVQASLVEPASAGARKMLAAKSNRPSTLTTTLSLSQREALFLGARSVLGAKTGPGRDANLAQLADVETCRDSWTKLSY